MKKITLPFVFCGLFAIAVSGQQIKSNFPTASSGKTNTAGSLNLSNRTACQGVLPNYTNMIPDGAGGVTSQDFEAEFDAYDGMAADDFVTPLDGISSICQIAITGIISGGAGFPADPDSAIVLKIYEDTGAGMPGAEIFSETFPGTTDDDNDGSFILEPTTNYPLGAGQTYWLSVQVVMSYTLAGQWYWDTAGDNSGDIYAWQNPGGGFGNGCNTWNPHTNCSLAGVADLLMDISFNMTMETNSNSIETAISIFPNPATNLFTLKSDVSLKKLTIFDIGGRVVATRDLTVGSRENTIDISNLAAGAYLLHIESEKGVVVKSLVKQ